jgi:hypothetical protein
MQIDCGDGNLKSLPAARGYAYVQAPVLVQRKGTSRDCAW